MKKIYLCPTIKVYAVEPENVIATSGEPGDGGSGVIGAHGESKGGYWEDDDF